MRHPFIREDDITSSESVYNTLHLIISYDSSESVPQCVYRLVPVFNTKEMQI